MGQPTRDALAVTACTLALVAAAAPPRGPDPKVWAKAAKEANLAVE